MIDGLQNSLLHLCPFMETFYKLPEIIKDEMVNT